VPKMPDEGKPIPAALSLRCTECGYELTGLVEWRCPECGDWFDPRETWLENERATWAYHFENVCSRWQYAARIYLAVAAFVTLGLLVHRPITVLGGPLVVVGEWYVLYSGRRGLWVRVGYVTTCLAWGVVASILW
jgi:hypothetical protein